VADFHALRHTFISNMAGRGVHPKVAQSLARHSTIALTMDRYTHTAWQDMSDAVSQLPSFDIQPERAAATGTDGKPASDEGDSVLAFCLAQKGAKQVSSVQSRRVRATIQEPL